MSLDRATACDILGVTRGASEAEIKSAYKCLALEWHPDKHCNNETATEKFQEISSAYKVLTTKEKDVTVLKMDEMFDLFAQMFYHSRAAFNGFESDGYDYDYDDESDDGVAWESVGINRRNVPNKATDFSYTANRPTVSEASRNAEELMKEEERQKKLREKRKSKKKRQREKKREEKEKREEEATKEEEERRRNEEFLKRAKESAENAKRRAESNESIPKSTNNPLFQDTAQATSTTSRVNNISNNFNPAKSKSMRGPASPDSDDDMGWDQDSAFFAGAAATVNKKAAAASNAKMEKTKKKNSTKGDREEAESVRAMNSTQIDSMDPLVLQSRQMAVKGNEMAKCGHYPAAIELFTQAIQLDPRDFRFFGNRSFCFDQQKQYESALKDADRAITLSKEWPKGYFRKGRAFAGLKQYADAESAFEHVLKLDKNCQDAVEELQKVRVYRLMEMGFSRPQSDAAIRQYGSVQAALDALLTNGVEGVVNSFPEDVYISDEEDYITQTIEHSKLDCRNPMNLRSIWVGNLHSTVSEKQLGDLFGQFGEIESLRRLPDRFCAFINYKRPGEAARALDKLQGAEIGGHFLLIKFPDNPIVEGQPRTTVLKKTTNVKQPAAQQVKSQSINNYATQMDGSGNKVTGPVNGNECYFWRTTGCVFGDRCKFKHLSDTKGADLKPWQKVLHD